MICEVCRREATASSFAEVAPGEHERFYYCDEICRCSVWKRNDPDMIDPTPNELAALEHAGSMVGEHLTSINKFDVMRMSPEEYATMIRVGVSAYTDHLRDAGHTPEQIADNRAHRAGAAA